jgi:uncharacterized membrane protein YjjB (DUF3815 family)
MVYDIITDGLLAAMAAIGFGAISNPPKRSYLYIAILAAVGHALRFFLMNTLSFNIATATFCASLSIGAMSLWFGRRAYCPMTVLYIPALLPMVPGMYAYKTIFALIQFMHHHKDVALANLDLQAMMSNLVVTVSTVFLLALGASIFIFIMPVRVYSMTRRKLQNKI